MALILALNAGLMAGSGKSAENHISAVFPGS